MSDLKNKKCIPCEAGVIPFDISQKFINTKKKLMDGILQKMIKKFFFLEKNYVFKDFEVSQNFVNKICKISEEEGHHPDISFGWGYVKISITTHAIEGLSEMILF